MRVDKNNFFVKYKDISYTLCRKLFFGMLKVRRVEETIAQLYSEQEMRCPVHLCIGQEAIPVGVCENLKFNDVIFCSHRSHGYYIAKGGSIKQLMAELYGKMDGCTKGKGGSQHLAAPQIGFLGASAIVAGTIPIAVGAALAFKLKRERRVSVVDFGDGAVDEGVFYESLNFAALKNLPVVFICQNNSYATHAHQKLRQANIKIFQKAKAFGIFTIRVDGNDVLEVFKAAREAIRLVRLGKGPVFIEGITYRCLEHVGPNYDYKLGYRSKKELDKWLKRCPLKRLKKILLNRRLIKKKEIEKKELEISYEIKKAVLFAKKSPFPSSKELVTDIYID